MEFNSVTETLHSRGDVVVGMVIVKAFGIDRVSSGLKVNHIEIQKVKCRGKFYPLRSIRRYMPSETQ